jgi:UDP-GlcNAc:undecaprenyl-phosphate GlcNAc-1-phosphate transferase
MGDAGAMFLGLLMAASTMVIGGQVADQFSGQTYFFFAPLFIPFFILGVPLFDMAFAIVRRAARRVGLADADKEHLHHRLMRLGHGQRRSVLILWAWTAILSGIVLIPTYTGQGNAIVPFVIAALAIALFTLFHPRIRAARGENGVSDQQQELPLEG